ncbi:hypothetical protein AX769_14960 [Frondihabitans sp. PAMC 28766]|nr:hypothetical protein AX769_14960 [Frondihabitans sp. PAMC 28766]
MSSFSVSSEAVEQASARLADRSAEFERRVVALNSFVVTVIDSEWSGAAAEAFGAISSSGITVRTRSTLHSHGSQRCSPSRPACMRRPRAM